MPTFRFHVHDGQTTLDHEGTELEDVAAAKRHAVVYAADLMRSDPQTFVGDEDWRMEVTNERGLTMFTLNFFVSFAPP